MAESWAFLGCMGSLDVPGLVFPKRFAMGTKQLCWRHACRIATGLESATGSPSQESGLKNLGPVATS